MSARSVRIFFVTVYYCLFLVLVIEVRPINDIFQPEDCNCVIVSLMLMQVFIFQWVGSQEVVLGI